MSNQKIFQTTLKAISIMIRSFSILFLLNLVLGSTVFSATKERSDTIDIKHTVINISVNQYAKSIEGYAELRLKSKKNNVSYILLDLLKLNIDSVTVNNQSTTFTYDSLTLKVNLTQVMNTNDSATIRVYYYGNPKTDASFGGFYFIDQYAYNMGVALTSVPHNFGRCWFPCFDNFVERSTFTIICTTSLERTVASNGMLLSVTDNGNGTHTYTWQMNQPIPSYLTCVAINTYSVVQKTFIGLNGSVPVSLYCLPADTTKINSSFVHLEDAFHFFEDKFGAYSWDKLGYVLVPFIAGAMEHSTMISYPVAAVDGTTNSEDVMVHELSHQWFGDLVTCETAQDMWMNEGWADYLARLFKGFYYGQNAFLSDYLSNHEHVIRVSRFIDGGLYAVSNVPDSKTYGTTSYDRGADVAHTLRGYMGDELFFNCLKSYLDQYKFKSSNSALLRDHLTQCSGIDLSDFFNDWVFNPGFATFSIDSFAILNASSTYQTQVFIRQKLNSSDHYFNQVPLEITVVNNQWQREVHQVMMSGPCAQFVINSSIEPALVILDEANKISDASNGETKVIKQTGNNNYSNGRMNLSVQSVTDSVLLRIDHYYASPDRIKPEIKNLHISDYRYWKVIGLNMQNMQAKATLQYNGTNSTTTGYLDHTLITNSEDSIVLMYRPSSRHKWKIEEDVVFARGILSDKKGSVTINQLKNGEYAFAIYEAGKIDIHLDSPDSCAVFTSVQRFHNPSEVLLLIPTLTNTQLTIRTVSGNRASLQIYNSEGREIRSQNVSTGMHQTIVDVRDWMPGNYFVILTDESSGRTTKKFIIIK